MSEEGPSTKRQRRAQLLAEHAGPGGGSGAAPGGQQQPEQQQSPVVTSLFQVPAGLPREPSPGAMHGCRIATWYEQNDSSHSTYGSVLASGRDVYWSQVHLPHQQLQSDQHGKEGVLLPLRLRAPAVLQLQQLPPHAGEVQSLALCRLPSANPAADMLLATVDAFGAGSISRIRPVDEYTPVQAAATADGEAGSDSAAAGAVAVAGPVSAPEVVVQARITPMDTCREGGWAGIAFSGSSSVAGAAAAAAEPAFLATARCFAKDVCVYDVTTGKALRSFGCMQNPYALSFLPAGVLSKGDGNLLAVPEGHSVALWDVRAAGAAGGCVQRFSPGALGQPLYSLAWCPAQAGMLGAAGAERSVYLTEPRKWRVVSKWAGATRLAIHSLSFLDTDPRCAVLAGLDLEVVCGRWDAPGSNARPFESSRPADEAAAAGASSAGGAAAGGGGGGILEGQAGSGDKAYKPAALGAPGSGDRSRRGAPAAAAAAGGGAVGMDVDDGEGSAGGSGGVFSFRGDGRWLGVAKAAEEDVLAGFAASGNLVYAHIA